jgi:hypothetical protein
MNKRVVTGVLVLCFVILGVASGIALKIALTTQTGLQATHKEITLLEQKIRTSQSGTLSSMRGQIATLNGKIVALNKALSSIQTTVTAAQHARLGICWSEVAGSVDGNGNYLPGYVSIESPTLQGGVYSCGNGETYVSVVPSKG